jgi:pimeloyl-ACP methyl ester carboxylesterase
VKSVKSVTSVKWNEAWQRARPTLEGVVRGRAPGSEAGVELAFLDWGGDGELIVFHHANGFGAACFALVAAGLRERFRVIAFDARGHGDSTPVPARDNPDAYRWPRLAADYAAALASVVESTGRDRVRLAIGHSFGGVLTLAAAAERPGLIEEALLLDPVILPPSVLGAVEPQGPGVDLAVATRRRRAVFPSREAAYEHFAKRDLFRDFRPEALAIYVAEGLAETSSGEFRLKCDPQMEAAIFEQGRSLDVFAIAPQIEARTRLLHAARGNFTRDGYDELAARMPDARVEVCDGGHLFPMEQPELVLERIEL